MLQAIIRETTYYSDGMAELHRRVAVPFVPQIGMFIQDAWGLDTEVSAVGWDVETGDLIVWLEMNCDPKKAGLLVPAEFVEGQDAYGESGWIVHKLSRVEARW